MKCMYVYVYMCVCANDFFFIAVAFLVASFRFLESPGASGLSSEARTSIVNRISTLESIVASEAKRSRLSKWRRRYRSVIFFGRRSKSRVGR